MPPATGAAGEVGEEVGVLLVELAEPERVAVAVVEVLHAGGRHGEQRRGVEAEPHGPVVGDGLADLGGHALEELVGVGRPGGDPLDGVDDPRQQPARPWRSQYASGQIVAPPSWGVLAPRPHAAGGAAEHVPPTRGIAGGASRRIVTQTTNHQGATMHETPIPTTAPVKVAPDTYLIPNLAAAEPGTYVPVNSLVILGEEPIIVDTGAPVHREHWLDMVFGLVDPEDIRWVFLSHEDGDHTGSLDQVLEAAPQATLVMNFFSTERLGLERPVHLERMIWREPGETFDAGDRRLRLVLPPIFDGPATRGLFDEKTGVLWSVDTFAALTTGAVHHVEDLPKDLYEESFMFFNSLISPWHQFLDPVRYNRHVDTVEALKPRAIASAHGPILVGDAIHDAFDRVRTLAGEPIIAPPGQEALAGDPRRRSSSAWPSAPAVGELAEQLPVSRPAVSQHLRVLKETGLVDDETVGTRRIYRLNPAGVQRVTRSARHVLERALANYQPPSATTPRRTRHDPGSRHGGPQGDRRDGPIERAFSVFTDRFGDIKPPEHNLLGAPIVTTLRTARRWTHLRPSRGRQRSATSPAFSPTSLRTGSCSAGTSGPRGSSRPTSTTPARSSALHRRGARAHPRGARAPPLDRHGPGWDGIYYGVEGDEGWPLYLARFAGLISSDTVRVPLVCRPTLPRRG